MLYDMSASFNFDKQSILKKSVISTAKDLIIKGSLHVVLPDGTKFTCDGLEEGTHANIFLYDWHVFDRVLSHADIGFGEDYIQGLWDTDNLLNLLQLAIENVDAYQDKLEGHFFARTYYYLKHKLRANSSAGSKQNIHKHYDLGNDFFQLWLDKSMTYSGALFHGDDTLSLEAAQKAKYRRILEKLNPSSDDHILEIGCGWGGFMEQAASKACHVYGVTISKEQADYAKRRFKDRHFETDIASNLEIHLQDYRDLEEQFDYIVSIGMFEHVGHPYWKDYMQTLKRCLKPGGKIMLQSIVIRDDLFQVYKDYSDFIREYIFPGGMLPSYSQFEQEANQAHLAINEVFYFGQDYALTLEKWLQNFDGNLGKIKALGFDDDFIRKWRFYLAICIALFRVGRINVMQVELQHV